MPEKKLEDMTRKEVEGFLTKAWKKVDGVSLFNQMNWSLSEPRCPCNGCNQVYQTWLELGEALYKDNMSAYEERVRETNLRREQRKEERRLSGSLGRGSRQFVGAYS